MRLHLRISILVFCLAATCGLALANEADRAAGAEIYKNLCAKCHGDKGQGVPNEFDEPLYGERSVHSLTKLIDKTMPEDEPEKCNSEDSRKVALYIYDAF